MSEVENPSLRGSGEQLTVADIHKLVAATTPHFALQVRNRVRRLTESLPPDSPVRVEADRQITKLEQLANHGETRGAPAQSGQQPLDSVEVSR